MKKFKAIYVFILGTLFGASFIMMVGYLYIGQIFGTIPQTIPINSNLVISSLRTGIQSICTYNNATSDKYSKFDKVWTALNQQYYEKNKLDMEKMIDNGLKGYVDAIGDPYTVYFTTKENESFQTDLKGEKDFEGIGAVVAKKQDGVLIEEVIKGSPAYKAGLKPLDLLLEINGEKTKNLNLTDAVNKIRGPAGTQVELTIFRANEKDNILKIKVTREKIVVPSVMGKIFNLTGGKNIGYLNISIIGEDTERALNNWIKENKSKNLSGIILDLRGNGGGYLPIAAEILYHFIPKDKVVVSTKYRNYAGETYNSLGYGDLEGIPVIVMIDGLSASASEIIAMALKENIGAKLLGTKSFGKGSIQTVTELENGSSLKYTIGKWYTPNGENIDGVGINPDIKIEFDKQLYNEKEIDNQLEKAKQEIINFYK